MPSKSSEESLELQIPSVFHSQTNINMRDNACNILEVNPSVYVIKENGNVDQNNLTDYGEEVEICPVDEKV